jgi:hypothetical protein
MLIDKDYKQRLRRMKLRKYGFLAGEKVDVFEKITALKVSNWADPSQTQLLVWKTEGYPEGEEY